MAEQPSSDLVQSPDGESSREAPAELDNFLHADDQHLSEDLGCERHNQPRVMLHLQSTFKLIFLKGYMPRMTASRHLVKPGTPGVISFTAVSINL